MTGSWVYQSLYNNEDFDYKDTERDYKPELDAGEMKEQLDKAHKVE